MNRHKENIKEFNMGLKIVRARLNGALPLLNDIIENSKDGNELVRARLIKERLDSCLHLINEK